MPTVAEVIRNARSGSIWEDDAGRLWVVKDTPTGKELARHEKGMPGWISVHTAACVELAGLRPAAERANGKS